MEHAAYGALQWWWSCCDDALKPQRDPNLEARACAFPPSTCDIRSTDVVDTATI